MNDPGWQVNAVGTGPTTGEAPASGTGQAHDESGACDEATSCPVVGGGQRWAASLPGS